METAAWILIIFLSTALFLFIATGIVLLINLIGFTKEAKKIVVQSQDIAEKADDIVGNVRDMTTVGGLVKHFVNAYTESETEKGPTAKKGKK